MFFPLFAKDAFPSPSWDYPPTVVVGLIYLKHFAKNLIKSQKSSIFLESTLTISSYLSLNSEKISKISSSFMY